MCNGISVRNGVALLAKVQASVGNVGVKRWVKDAAYFLQKLQGIVSDSIEVLAQTELIPSGSFALGSPSGDVITTKGPPTKTSVESGYRIFEYASSDPALFRVYVFNTNDQLIYYRLLSEDLQGGTESVNTWLTAYGNPEAMVVSTMSHSALRLMYPTAGFTIIVEGQTGIVMLYEGFKPMTLDEYLNSWGSGIDKTQVKLATTPIPPGAGFLPGECTVLIGCGTTLGCRTTAGLATGLGCIPVDPIDFIIWIHQGGIGFIGGIAFLLMLIGAAIVLTSRGDKERVKLGVTLFKAAIAGLVMVVFAVFLLSLIGVDLLGIFSR